MPNSAPEITTDTDLRARVNNLEHWRTQLEIANARAEEQRKHLDKRFDVVEKQINEVSGNIKWAVRLIIGALLLAIITFGIQGGFNVKG